MFDKMWKRALLVGVVGLAVAAVTVGQIGAQNRPELVARSGDGEHAGFSTDAVLYNQYDNPNGIGIVTQNFEAVYDAYDAFLADDFIVPNGKNWIINQIDVDGIYFNGPGPADSFNTFLHKHNSATGKPSNSPQKTALNRPYTVVGASTFRIGPISPALRVNATNAVRHWWVSVQANMAFSAGGEFGWNSRNVQSNTGAHWKNPGNGFGTGCTTYTLMNTCIGVGEGPDLMFTLYGTQTP
jgi:hypothetical protein